MSPRATRPAGTGRVGSPFSLAARPAASTGSWWTFEKVGIALLLLAAAVAAAALFAIKSGFAQRLARSR